MLDPPGRLTRTYVYHPSPPELGHTSNQYNILEVPLEFNSHKRQETSLVISDIQKESFGELLTHPFKFSLDRSTKEKPDIRSERLFPASATLASMPIVGLSIVISNDSLPPIFKSIFIKMIQTYGQLCGVPLIGYGQSTGPLHPISRLPAAPLSIFPLAFPSSIC